MEICGWWVVSKGELGEEVREVMVGRGKGVFCSVMVRVIREYWFLL